ncbi:hypothetical protein HMPREF1987_00051 [Peptostreptococcaceae bacterium oral taxon 113 str. W5053]|nr:hypothetical protein HMPREF1987_00051 [Peptostreptococcaceae bacterium oral taxon 113 str. W5053]
MDIGIIITIIASIISVFCLIMLFQVNGRLKRMKKRYDILLKGKGELDLEELLLCYGEEMDKIKLKEKEIDLKMSTLNNKISSSLNKIGFLSYNAYPDAAGEKSYSLCMLDSYNNGIILSNLFGREHSVTYGKLVQSGNPSVDLSPEEQSVLNRTLNRY